MHRRCTGGDVAGMVEVALRTAPGAHRMLRSLVTAAGAEALIVDLLDANREGVAFYDALGYQPHGALVAKHWI